MSSKLFVFGLGYVGMRLATALLAEGWAVAGTTRSADKAAQLAALGVDVFAPDSEQASTALLEATHLLATAAPDSGGDPFLQMFGGGLPAAPELAWAGYLSTTGVYGDLQGAAADEDTPTNPTADRSRWRVLAEEQWREVEPAAHIFRLPGIYGPDRNVLRQIVEGTARRIVKPGHRFSRIHVDDIVATLLASMARPRPGAIYNVADDLPAETAEIMAYGADLLGRPAPPAVAFETAELSPMARSFYKDRRTVRNDLIKQELGVRLRYPSYREGLAALAADYSAG